MGNPEDWKRKIREIEGKRNQGSQLAARRLAHLETELAAYENRVKTEVAEFASSEEARFSTRTRATWQMATGRDGSYEPRLCPFEEVLSSS